MLSRTPSAAFTPCYHPAKTVTHPSDREVITTIYTNGYPKTTSSIVYFPFPYMYDHSVLVLGIVSVLCVLKFDFVFLLFLFVCRSLFFTAFGNRSCTFGVCFTINEWTNGRMNETTDTAVASLIFTMPVHCARNHFLHYSLAMCLLLCLGFYVRRRASMTCRPNCICMDNLFSFEFTRLPPLSFPDL